MPLTSDNSESTTKEGDRISAANANLPTVQWAQEAWSKGASQVMENQMLTAGVVMVGGLAIHNKEVIAKSGKALATDLLVGAEKEASSLVSSLLSERYAGAKILEIGRSSLKTGLSKLEQPNKTGAFSALTRKNDLLAVKIPEGGFPYIEYPKGETFVKEGKLWKDLNGYELNAKLDLVASKAGPELHVTSPDWPLKSIHYTDGHLGLENPMNGALIEVDPLFRTQVGFRDINGTTFAAQYKADELISVIRTTADGQIDVLPALTFGRRTGFELGHAHVSETTIRGQIFHSLNGKSYATVEEAMENSARMLEINPRDIGSARSNWATSHFNIESNFPDDYSGRLVRTRGGIMRQSSILEDVSAAEMRQRNRVLKWEQQ
ncbi:hypothetical protein KA344_03505 [bacterium]|jgi:hypothetical protein|nr:hypothetical protein [bacterium]